MYGNFELATISLAKILLDPRNPRLVTLKPLTTQREIVDYFFEHENLSEFLVKIVSEGRNLGAERPYVVKDGTSYVVVEGNTRIAAYKLLMGLLEPSNKHKGKVPAVPAALKKQLAEVECSVAPTREALLPIMAGAHFGRGDKSKWGYLGSRKAVYDEWQAGHSIGALAAAFGKKKGQIRDYIVEYLLYLKALTLKWSEEERDRLQDPSVEFNPPVRFLQSAGHREKMGIFIDREELKVKFDDELAEQKYHYLVLKLVADEKKKFKATSSYEDVFAEFKPGKPASPSPSPGPAPAPSPTPSPPAKKGALFPYPAKAQNQLIQQLGKEANTLNCNYYPGAGTALLRSVVEAILKHIIDQQNANKTNQLLSLEKAIDICLGKDIHLGVDDVKILKEFRKQHLDYVNLSSHATVIPNKTRLFAARDCIDQFVKRYI